MAYLRLRGLPFNVTVQDVLAFFSQHEMVDRVSDGDGAAMLLTKSNGRPSGQAVVQMRSRYDAEVAKAALDKRYMGDRYIEVFAYGSEVEGNVDGAEGTPQCQASVDHEVAKQHGLELAQQCSPQWHPPTAGEKGWGAVAPPPVLKDNPWGEMFNFIQPAPQLTCI
jgi:hypothetical protein